MSANLSSVAVMMLVSIDKDTDKAFLFNSKSAQSRCLNMLKKENKEYGVRLCSQPVFHLEELVTTACGTATATSNHSELPSVQISGIRLLISLIRAFAKQLDVSTNDGTSVLEQYSSQIVASCKHALNAENLLKESVPGHFHRLFSAGCEALFVMISEDLISDSVVIKRLLQPVLLPPEEICFIPFPGNDPKEKEPLLMSSPSVTDDSRSYPLFRLSKLCFLAKVFMLIALGEVPLQQSTVSVVAAEIQKEETGRAIHWAAVAIDGFRLQDYCHKTPSKASSGLTYKNISDLDESVIQMLIKSWPTLSASAVSLIIKAKKAVDNENDQSESLQQWLDKLIPVIVKGLRHSLSILNGTTPSPDQLIATETASMCIYAVRLLVRENEHVGEGICSVELGDIAQSASKLSLNSNDKVFLQQSCGLIQDLCHQYRAIGVNVSILTRVVVTPLVIWQSSPSIIRPSHETIMSSCIRSSQLLFLSHSEHGKSNFEKALVQLVLMLLKEKNGSEVKLVPEACLSLLQACCEKTTMTQEEWGKIANYSASIGLWNAWAAICTALPSGCGIKCSIDAIKMSLADLQSGPRHTAALTALRTALHSASSKDPSLLCVVLRCLGFEILQLLRAHGMRLLSGEGFDENRVTVCAESVKVNIMALQYLNSVSEEESKCVSFTSTMFEVLIECVSLNGMPNHPSGKDGADETIGRMCAQVFVHVARTTPMVFKSTMANISSESRVVLEAAVRADMSGYAAPKRETKKKLSLKGFVK